MNPLPEPTPALSIRSLIDIAAFQVLLDNFTGLTGLSTAMLDLKGEILAASRWQPICAEFHRKTTATASRCLESDTVLASQLARGERYTLYHCRNGLVDVAAPITIDNVHVGNLFVGQFFFEPPDPAGFARQADEFGFDRASYLEALAKVPIVSHERINQVIELLTTLTGIIGHAGLDKKRLFEANWQLEQRVQERTLELTFSHERLRVLTEAAFEGIILSENGVIIEANHSIAAMFGFDNPVQLIGLDVMNFIVPERRAEVEMRISTGYAEPYETLGLTRNGTVIPVEIHGRTFFCQGRRVRGTAVRDLTEQKKAEKEIQTLRGILPLCSFCKKIRDDKGYWEQVDIYLHKHTEAGISHSVCPECMKKHYPEYDCGDKTGI